YTWGDYSDPANLEEFGRQGVQVQTDSFASNEELIAKLGATRGTSGYDIVVPTSTYLTLMSKNGLLEKLDLGTIPNLANLDPKFQDSIADPQNAYAVCKNWGTTGFLYDSTVITRPMNSWADFLEAAQNEASNNVSLLEDPAEIAVIYLAAKGYDPLSTDPKIVAECADYLTNQLAPHVRAFSSTPQNFIIQGSMTLVHAFNGDARRGYLEAENPERWKWVFPTPTANRWMDTWAIPVGVQHPDAAYAFINFMLQPDQALKDVDYIGYSTGLTGQRELAEAAGLEMLDVLFPPAEILDRLVTLEITEASGAWVDMYGAMQAKAGA
ncbi:MAG: spermidine/putrescine ABC transporter substrate-binding protein, partial [Renibacterium salmoninarum]|nr:spermidine/putrescine ABC transporter substrate-binding protein [Renibacterium salmoninarum]